MWGHTCYNAIIFINFNVIYLHRLGPYRRATWISSKCSSHCCTQNNEILLVKNPLIRYYIRRCKSIINYIIEKKINSRVWPFDSIGMPISETWGKGISKRLSLITIISRTLDLWYYLSRIQWWKLHYIYFSEFCFIVYWLIIGTY